MDFLTLQTNTPSDANTLFNLALREKIIARLETPTTVLLCGKRQTLDAFASSCKITTTEVPSKPLKPYRHNLPHQKIQPHTEMIPRSSRSWFYATELASIYKFPTPSSGKNVVVGIVSFGGGLVGSIDSNGVLTNGDCQDYWTLCNISSSNFPTVVVKPLLGATNDPSDFGSTAENTLDVQTVGACCPTSDTTIILYIVPNSISNFAAVINYMLSTPAVVNGSPVKPNLISISWGLPEIYLSATQITNANSAFAAAVSQGVTICTATGDNGANNGVGGTGKYTDFPSSSPNVVACGGTGLVCPNLTYDNATIEYAWADGGGGISRVFSKPSYQGSLSVTKRSTPDVATVADPNTGVLFIVDGETVVYGGTSVSAPTVTGFLATINCRTWANPGFYGTPLSNFNDILTGDNGGYYAATGYDNCTGLGSPKGDLLRNLFVVRVSSVNLNTTAVLVGTTKTYQAVATVSPSNAANKTVTWTSSNTNVATVSSSGLITGVAVGSAVISVVSQDGNKRASLTVTVNQSAAGVSVTPSSLTIRRGRTGRITATVAPSNAANKNVIWTSLNTAVARVSSGTVTGVAVGTTTIRVTTLDGGFTASCSVTVTA